MSAMQRLVGDTEDRAEAQARKATIGSGSCAEIGDVVVQRDMAANGVLRHCPSVIEAAP